MMVGAFQVLNLFFTLLSRKANAYSKAAAAAAAAGTAPPSPELPKTYIAKTSFYTKLADGAEGYAYKGVRRWTKKVDVFSKDMLIFPIHCHSNHWTLAVVNFRERRFEYYDSLRGSPDEVLINLRKWLQEESRDKKGAEFDVEGWTDVSFKSGTPLQKNGFDCGVFMSRTAECDGGHFLLGARRGGLTGRHTCQVPLARRAARLQPGGHAVLPGAHGARDPRDRAPGRAGRGGRARGLVGPRPARAGDAVAEEVEAFSRTWHVLLKAR